MTSKWVFKLWLVFVYNCCTTISPTLLGISNTRNVEWNKKVYNVSVCYEFFSTIWDAEGQKWGYHRNVIIYSYETSIIKCSALTHKWVWPGCESIKFSSTHSKDNLKGGIDIHWITLPFLKYCISNLGGERCLSLYWHYKHTEQKMWENMLM